MKIFINDLNSHTARALIEEFKAGEGNENIIVGSTKGEKCKNPLVSESVRDSNKVKVLAMVASSDLVVYTIERNMIEASEALRELKKTHYEGVKTFIGISPLLTWGNTGAAPFVEETYTGRKCLNDRYTAIKTFENTIINSNREVLVTRVIGVGVVYGKGESFLKDIFMNAWLCSTSENVLTKTNVAQDGSNTVAAIHVGDLAKVVNAVATSPPESPYILAIDKSKSTLKDISAAIANYLSKTGIREPTEDEVARINAQLASEKDQYDALFANLVFDLETASVGNLGIEWTAENGIIENVAAVANEYIAYNNLLPVKVVLLGPPGSGKSYWGKKISELYYIHHLNVSDIIAEAMQSTDPEFLAEIQKAKDENPEDKERIPLKSLANIVRRALQAPERRNKGWVLDGLPRSHAEAKYIFTDRGEEGKDEPADEAAEADLVIDKMLVPTAVVELYADDSKLQQTIMDLPEDAVAGTHNTEEGLKRRLSKYREVNSKSDTARSYFESVAKTDVLVVPGSKFTNNASVLTSLQVCIERGAKPQNFHPTTQEIIQARVDKEAADRRKVIDDMQAKFEQEQIEAQRVAEEENTHEKRLLEIRRQLDVVDHARSMPLRTFLMEGIIPALANGLTEICKMQPDDPVDYLAEYLFKSTK